MAKESSSTGLSITSVIFIILVTLKLLNIEPVAHWSWVWIILFAIIPVIIFIIALIIAIIVAIFSAIFK